MSQSSLWYASRSETCETQPLAGDLRVDLVVIGGGFTGCSAALEAAGKGASVALLEAQTIGFGGSGRNVGLVNAGLWLPPDQVIDQMGQGAGERLVRVLGDAPQHVFDLIKQHQISCEATRNGTLHLAHSPAGLQGLDARFRQGNRYGASLQLLDAAETEQRTGSARYHGALFDPRAGTIQPLSYCQGLARAAQATGAQIFTQTPVNRISRLGNAWEVRTETGVVTAKSLLLATNAYFQGIRTLFQPTFVPVSYCQFATAPLSAAEREQVLAGGEGCWDTALVMSSFRLDQAGRLILGGMGNSDGLASPVHRQWARRKLAQVFPDLAAKPFEHSWSGRIAMTGDHVPKVVEFGPQAMAVYGYSGRGIGPGTVFGTAAAQALLTGKRTHLPVPVTPAHRENLTAVRAAFFETGAAAAHLVSART